MAPSQDPRIPSDVSYFKLWLTQRVLNTLGLLGTRRVLSKLFPKPSITHFDVKTHPGVEGYVALTMDDAFHSGQGQGASMLPEVQKVLHDNDAKATFFVMLDGCEGVADNVIENLLKDGHELGNHLVSDRPYDQDSEAEFDLNLVKTQQKLEGWQGSPPVWFRAPHGKLSPTMKSVLKRHGLTNVMMDCYGHDPFVPDSRFLADFMLKQVTHGSILLIHMPEEGFREWNLEGLRLLVEGLKNKGLKLVTLSELSKLAK